MITDEPLLLLASILALGGVVLGGGAVVWARNIRHSRR